MVLSFLEATMVCMHVVSLEACFAEPLLGEVFLWWHKGLKIKLCVVAYCDYIYIYIYISCLPFIFLLFIVCYVHLSTQKLVKHNASHQGHV